MFQVISRKLIEDEINKWKNTEEYKKLSENQKEILRRNIKSIVIKTQGTISQQKKEIETKQYSGQNPPYFTPKATSLLRELGILNICRRIIAQL